MDNIPWLLRIPGLRRYGLRIARAERRAEALGGKVRDLKGRQLSSVVLQQLLSAKHHALLAQSDARASAATRDEAFRGRSVAYASEIASAKSPASGADFPIRSVNIEGLTWHVPVLPSPGDGLAERILEESWLPLRRILATRDIALGTAMLDIGANIGTTSIPRVILGDFQYIYAAEPDPANYHCLVRNVAVNGLRGFVLPDRIAMGATDGTVTLHRKQGIGQHRLAAAPQSSNDVQVPIATLDRWIDTIGVDVQALAFVKIDTQGSELHVLQGGSRLLACPHIAWQIEFSPALLRRTKSSATELIGLLERQFQWFINLDVHATPRSRPTSALRDALASLGDRFTDLVLYGAMPRS